MAASEKEPRALNSANGNDIFAASEKDPRALNSANGNDIFAASEKEPRALNSANGNGIAASDHDFDAGDSGYDDEWEGDIGGEPGGNSTPAETARQTRKRKRVSPAEAKKKPRDSRQAGPRAAYGGRKELHIAGQRALKQLVKDFPPVAVTARAAAQFSCCR